MDGKWGDSFAAINQLSLSSVQWPFLKHVRFRLSFHPAVQFSMLTLAFRSKTNWASVDLSLQCKQSWQKCWKKIVKISGHQNNSQDFFTVQKSCTIFRFLRQYCPLFPLTFFGEVGVRWDHGGNGKSGSSSRVQLAGIHKAALNDYTVSSTTVGLVWTWFNCQMYKTDVICNHEPASFYVDQLVLTSWSFSTALARM